jgi:hypothetical protein
VSARFNLERSSPPISSSGKMWKDVESCCLKSRVALMGDAGNSAPHLHKSDHMCGIDSGNERRLRKIRKIRKKRPRKIAFRGSLASFTQHAAQQHPLIIPSFIHLLFGIMTAGQVIKCRAAVAWEPNKPLCTLHTLIIVIFSYSHFSYNITREITLVIYIVSYS